MGFTERDRRNAALLKLYKAVGNVARILEDTVGRDPLSQPEVPQHGPS